MHVSTIAGQGGVAAGAGAVGTTTQRTTLASDDPAVVSLGVLDDWDSTDACKVATGGNIVDVAPVFDTNAYTAGDVLFDSTEIVGATRISGGSTKLTSLAWIDTNDNTAAVITFFFFRSNVSLGTLNSAPDIDDTEILEYQGHVALATTDFFDVTGAKVAVIRNLNLILEPTTGTSIWVAGSSAGTPTHTAGGAKLRLGFEYLS